MSRTNNDMSIYNLPLWSVPFGRVLLENIDYTFNIKHILDIGSGTGFPLLELSQRFSISTHLHGNSVVQKAIDYIQQKITILSLDVVETWILKAGEAKESILEEIGNKLDKNKDVFLKFKVPFVCIISKRYL